MANGKLTPADWGRFMPIHSAPSHKGPWFYRKTECVVAEFETDREAALAVLPSELELHEPATAFMVAETNHWTTLGPYSEVYVGILCTYNGEMFGYCAGVYVTGENSQLVGREVWGFGKKRPARIEVKAHDNGSVTAEMDVRPGDGALRIVMQPHRNEASLDGLPLICLKVIPSAEGRPAPSLAQLVTVTFKADPLVGSDGKSEVFSGPGEMSFGASSDVRFPVVKMLRCVYAHFNADLPYGRILKTYGDEDLLACV
jgi:acetoacetate decarboxylase